MIIGPVGFNHAPKPNEPRVYKTFISSYTDWKSFSKARKVTDCTGLTEAEARERCGMYNANRNARQIRKGTKMEYTIE